MPLQQGANGYKTLAAELDTAERAFFWPGPNALKEKLHETFRVVHSTEFLVKAASVSI